MVTNLNIFIILSLHLINSVEILCNNLPTIGILAQEILPFRLDEFYPATSYISAPYVEAVEISGAQVIPIFVNQSESYYRWITQSINGVIIPGGGAPLTPGNPYYDAVTIIYNIAQEMNQKGTYFPIMAICLGFEALLTISNNHRHLQTICNIRYKNYPLDFQSEPEESLMFSGIDEDSKAFLKYFPSTIGNHRWCTTLRNFTQTHLPEQWNIITTSISPQGLRFISSIEHKKYPFFAVQYHPEREMLQWSTEPSISRSQSIIIKANQHFYQKLIQLSIQNSNKFYDDELEENLIENFDTTFTKPNGTIFNKLYLFY